MSDQRVAISNDDFDRLISLQQSGDYTQFYFEQFQAGSTIAGLYLPGPTGQGLFGSFSHNAATDFVSENEFNQRQTEISDVISQRIIQDIENSFDRDGFYSLPTAQEVFAVEVQAFEALGLPANSYAGHDLADFLAFDNSDPSLGQTWIGAAGDFLESMGDQGQEYYVHNGEILSYDEVVASGDFAIVGAFVFGPGGVELDTVTGVFTYQGQRYHSGQLETEDGIHFVNHAEFGRIPVGITFGHTVQLLAALNDFDVPEESIETFLTILTGGIIEADEWAEILGRGRFEECFGSGTPIGMWPLDTLLKPGAEGVYDQDKVRAKIWTKSIEKIRIEDCVVSFDEKGNLVPGRVTKTFQNDVKILLDFFGTRVTPGHVYYRTDSKKAHKFETLIDVLRDDGVIQNVEGVDIRAATGLPTSDARDGFVWAVTGQLSEGSDSVAVVEQAKIRRGTRVITDDGRDLCVEDFIVAGGGTVNEDGFVCIGDQQMPFHWIFGDTLPKPEDYVLQRSGTTLEEIYKASEWEDQRPHMPVPMVRDGGPVQPLSQAGLSAMPANAPKAFEAGATPTGPVLNRKHRKAAEATLRKFTKLKKTVH